MKNKIIKLLAFIFTSLTFFTQIYCQEGDEKISLKTSRWESKFSYLNFPMSAETGLFTINNDFSSFIKAGINYNIQDSFEINALFGSDFNYKNYIINVSFQYNLLDNAFDFSSFQNKTYSANVDFSFPINIGRIFLPFVFGQKQFTYNDLSENTKDHFMYLAWSPKLDFLLYDDGFIRIDGKVENCINYLYTENFAFDILKINLDSIFFTRYFDFALGIRYFNACEIHKENRDFEINQRIDLFTKRLSFSDNHFSYSDIFLIENENRFYFLRPFNSSFTASNIFISTFENVGLGFLENQADFLWSLGLGLGYNLFTEVPFTLQFGIDNTFSPILSIFVVSSF